MLKPACIIIPLALLAACEKGVKPAATQRSKSAPAVAATPTVDQTPELETDPHALYARPTYTPDLAWAEEQADRIRKLVDEENARMQASRDGFTATANHTCPIMQKMKLNASTAVEHTVEFEGKVIGFCCADCVEAWASMGDDERRAMLTTVLNKK